MKEKWVDINGFEDYQISNRGKVYSKKLAKLLKPMKRTINDNPYVIFTINNKRIYKRIDSLILEYFIEEKPNEKSIPIHLDGNPDNDGIDNLKWGSKSELKIHLNKIKEDNGGEIEDSDDEQWVYIDNYENYQISNKGRVYNKTSGKFLVPVKGSWGRGEIALTKNGKVTRVAIHTLVLEHFGYKKPSSDHVVVHLDMSEDNNDLENLQWMTRKELKIFIAKHKIKNAVLEDTEDEQWKNIPGYENYKISTLGNIFNLESGEFLNPTISGDYFSVNLSNVQEEKKAKLFRIHRLVASTFLPNPENKKLIDHINNNKLDNRLENLRWATHKENSNYYNDNHKPKYKNHILQYDLKGNFIREWESVKDITKSNDKFGHKIYDCLGGRSAHAYGYVWKYKNKKVYKVESKEDEVFENIGIIGKYDFSLYEISNYGNIRNTKRGTYCKPLIGLDGYLLTTLHDQNTNKGISKSVHRLVAITFIEGRTEEKKWVNHKDENKLNCHSKNLEWVTPKQNSDHSVSKKVNKIDIETGEILETYVSVREAGEAMGKNHYKNRISLCATGKISSYKGYKWEYV